MNSSIESEPKLRILHVLRAPIGGLFRHVLDLARAQIARGHAVGIIADSLMGGDRAAETLAELAPVLELGLVRIPMHRQPHVLDIVDAVKIAAIARRMRPDVVHGHGSKGGLFARLPGLLPRTGKTIYAYTPHGGSFNHAAGPLVQSVYMAVERLLERGTDIFLFESAFIAERFYARVGQTKAIVRVVLNGISPAEFVPVVSMPDAAEFVYVGELRSAKGIDTLLAAMSELAHNKGLASRLVCVGSGPDKFKLAALAEKLGLQGRVSFPGPLPARVAFSNGRILVVPSRAESLPYVVLEAAGAQMPMVATNAGGIGEIFGPYAHRLIPCDQPSTLAAALADMLQMDAAKRGQQAQDLAAFVSTRFTIEGMADAVLAGYREAIMRKSCGDARVDPSLVVSS